MTQKPVSPITPKYVLLDLAGMFFLGIGLARQFGHIDLIPAPPGLENYAIPYIVIGTILMTLAAWHLLQNIRRKKSER